QHRLQGDNEVPGGLPDGRARQGRDAVRRVRGRGPAPGRGREDGALRAEHVLHHRLQVGGPGRRADVLPRPGQRAGRRRALQVQRQVRRAAGGHGEPQRHLPVRGRPRGRRGDGPRGHRLQDLRRPAVLPDEPRHDRGRGDGHDRPRVRRAHRARAADGVRARAEPADRTADGGGGRLMSAGLRGAIESAPVTRLHEHRSYDPADFGVPSGREEEWRFTPLRRLRGLHTDAPVGPAAKLTVEVDPAPEVKTFSAERGSYLLGRSFIPADRVSARAYASFGEATVITIPAGAGASLSVVSLQDWADDAVHLTQHYATLGRDARLRHTAVTLGGSVVRLAPSVRYDGPGGDAELTGLYFAD